MTLKLFGTGIILPVIDDPSLDSYNSKDNLIVTLDDLTPWHLRATFSDSKYKPLGSKRHEFDIDYNADASVPYEAYIRVVFRIGPVMEFASFIAPTPQDQITNACATCGNQAAADLLRNVDYRSEKEIAFLVQKAKRLPLGPAVFNLGIQFLDPSSKQTSAIIYDPTIPNDGS